MDLLVGVEYERTTFGSDGVLVDRGISLANRRPDLYVDEVTSAQFEWVSPPVRSAGELSDHYLAQERELSALARDMGVLPVPMSETGSGEPSAVNPESRQSRFYPFIIGGENYHHLIPWAGIHYHIDIDPARAAEQYNALLAFISATPALTSTSLLDYSGTNGRNSHRQGHLVEKVFSDVPEERGYISDIRELMERDVRRRNLWKARYQEQGGSEVELFDEVFPVDSSGYAEVRFRPHNGRGTFELRMYDSAPAHLMVGVGALLMGYWGRIMEEKLPVRIATGDEEYSFGKREVVLPSWADREQLRSFQVAEGLGPLEIVSYLSALFHFARPWLKARREDHYLTPLSRMVLNGKNVSTQLEDTLLETHVPTGGNFPLEARKQGALFVWDLQQEALERLESVRR